MDPAIGALAQAQDEEGIRGRSVETWGSGLTLV